MSKGEKVQIKRALEEELFNQELLKLCSSRSETISNNSQVPNNKLFN